MEDEPYERGYLNRLGMVLNYNGIRVPRRTYLGRMATSPFRQKPHFLVIGAPKAGTTSLFEYLCQHPDVVEPFRKEIHFFNVHYYAGKAFYLANFPYRLGAGKLTGEATPDYLAHPLAPDRVHRMLGRVKLIAILRDPVDRAYSHYQMNVRNGVEAESFERALELEEERALRHIGMMERDPEYWMPRMMSYAYAYHGLYMQHIEAWLKVFPREDLLVLAFDDLAADPGAVVRRMLTHLGLPWPEGLDIDLSPRNIGGRYDQLAEATRASLAKRLGDENARLMTFLGRELDWS